jgi:uncharacterized protein
MNSIKMTSKGKPMIKQKIIDGHINLASTHYIPKKFIEDTASNMHQRMTAYGQDIPKAKLIDKLLTQYQDHQADELAEEMVRADIDHAILLFPDFSCCNVEMELSVEEIAEKHHQVLVRHPGKFSIFAGVDPRKGQEGLDFFEKCIKEYGFKGMKLYPPAGYSPSDTRLFPYYEICSREKIPVLSHTGPGWHSLDFSMGNPMLLDEATRQFPSVNFIMGHGGVSYLDDASYLCTYRENVYMDISGFTAVVHPDGWQKHLNNLFHMGMNHKIIFGTSWPAFRMTTTLQKLMQNFLPTESVFENIKSKELKMIMFKNVASLLKMEAN